jgi:hypothetical protein
MSASHPNYDVQRIGSTITRFLARCKAERRGLPARYYSPEGNCPQLLLLAEELRKFVTEIETLTEQGEDQDAA